VGCSSTECLLFLKTREPTKKEFFVKTNIGQLFHEGTKLLCLDDIFEVSERVAEMQPKVWVSTKTLADVLDLGADAHKAPQKIFVHYGRVYATPLLTLKYALDVDEQLANSLLPQIYSVQNILGKEDPVPLLHFENDPVLQEAASEATKQLVRQIQLLCTLSGSSDLYESIFTEIHKAVLGQRQSLVRGLLKKSDETLYSSKSGSVREFMTPALRQLYMNFEADVVVYLQKNFTDKNKAFKMSSFGRYLRRKAVSKTLFVENASIPILYKDFQDSQTQVWLSKDGSFQQKTVRKIF